MFNKDDEHLSHQWHLEKHTYGHQYLLCSFKKCRLKENNVTLLLRYFLQCYLALDGRLPGDFWENKTPTTYFKQQQQ